MLVTWIKTTKKTRKRKRKRKWEPKSKQKEKEKTGKRVRKINRKRKTENKKGKQDTKQKRALKNDREQEPTDKPEGEKKGYTLNATAAYTLNCVDRHSRVTCQSWHVYVSLRPGSQVEWCEKENLWAKRAEHGLGRKNRRGGGFPGVNGAWPRWKCMQYVKKGQVPIWIKLFKCCTLGVAVYSALTSPLIHMFASPIKAVRVWVSHLQPLQNLLNLFIPLLYRFSHRFFLFENQTNHEIRFSTFFEVRSN